MPTEQPAPEPDSEWMTAARTARRDPDQEDTRMLATLITQVLSGGQLDGTAIPTECLFLARLIKGQGWKQCKCHQ